MEVLSYQSVRRQNIWNQERRNLRAYLAHLVEYIMRRVCGDASAAVRTSIVEPFREVAKLLHPIRVDSELVRRFPFLVEHSVETVAYIKLFDHWDRIERLK